MPNSTLVTGLVTDLFYGERREERLEARLAEAKALGAELALLPELPLDPWAPASRQVRDADAEPANGPRHSIMERAARTVGIGLAGGAIVRDPATGARHNTALVFDDRGRLRGSYRKIHLPEEEGFWETCHYRPGSEPPEVIDAFGIRLGVQICSDVNRPELCHVLSAMGADAIFAPRATPRESYERWRVVLRATAITSAAYVLSVNRPGPEQETPIGGPSLAVAPDGEVLLETEEPVSVVTLDRAAVERARSEYPGYLEVNADLYARAWRKVAGRG